MPPVQAIKTVFQQSIDDCRALFNHCLQPPGPHTHAGIEAAFLQVFKSWESFLEDSMLAFMCGEVRVDGTAVVCHIRTANVEIARTILYQDKRWIEWTRADGVIDRFAYFFPTPNVIVAALNPIKGDLREITTVRNAIAHSSQKANRDYTELLQRKFGGAPGFQRPGHFLSTPNPVVANETFFDHYVSTLEAASVLITA